MFVCNLGNAVYVGHAGVGVAECFYNNGLGVGTESSINGSKIFRIDYGGVNALRSECVLNEVKGATIEVVGGNDMIACVRHVL